MKTRIRRVRLRIRYKRRSELVALVTLLTLVLATAACLGTLAWGQKEAAASGTQAPQAPFTPMRKYYLTQSAVDGDEPLTACASGYHMASLWEILDPSNLEYNTDLGFTLADSGAGPPTGYIGWVRTGWDSSTDSGVGRDNCAVWTTDAGSAWGTVARLPTNWTAGWEDMHVWDVGGNPCNLPLLRVWCVEDYPSSVYLPLVLRSY